MGKVLQFTGDNFRTKMRELENQQAEILAKYRQEKDPAERQKLHDEYGRISTERFALATDALDKG